MTEPKISVVMPVYRANTGLLCDAIESILNQTFNDFEFIIVFDDPTEKERALISGYATVDSRIRPIFHNKKTGLVRSLNEGVALARGKYIARMDADDFSYPHRFETQYNYMEGHPHVGVLGAGYVYIKNGVKKKPIFLPESSHDISVTAFLWGCPICHPVVMLRSEFIKTIEGPYSERYPHAEDYYLWVRCMGKTEMVNLPILLLEYNMTGENICSRFKESQLVESAAIKQEAARILGFPERELHGETLEQWYLRLKDHNDNSGIFERRMFNKMLAEGYYEHCLHCCRIGFGARRMYWGSPLSQYNDLVLIRKIRFAGACLLKMKL